MVNIVTELPGWILHRCAKEISDRVPGVTINKHTHDTRLTYYMPHRAMKYGRVKVRAIGFFTHPTENEITRYASRYDARVVMNQRVQQMLKDRGFSSVLIRPGVERQKPITFGVVGSVKTSSNRKGEHLVAEMVKAGYKVEAWGSGWPCPTSMGDRDAFYASIDYLVVPSLLEGGPMGVIEAIAAGKPVIAPDTGWCWEYPVIRYEIGSWHSLQVVLQQLTHAPLWSEWADAHARLFSSLVS